MQRLHEAPARDRQTEAAVEQLRDFGEREATLLIEQDRQRHGLGPEVHGRGAERIRRLQGMPALHAPLTPGALPDGDAKLGDHRALYRQVFEVLRVDPLPPEPAAAGRTGPRQRRVVADVNRFGPTPIGRAAVGGAGFAAGPLGMGLGRPRENGAACRLARRRAASRSSFSRSFSRRSRWRSISDRFRSSRRRSISRAWSSMICSGSRADWSSRRRGTRSL